MFCNRPIPRVTFIAMLDGDVRASKTPPLFLCKNQKPLPQLLFFFVRKNPNHPNHHSLPKMSKKLDMSLDDVIRDSRRSGGHNDSSRGRGRASSGPGPDRRFASHNAVRTAPYYVPQVTWVVRSLSLYSLYVWYPRK